MSSFTSAIKKNNQIDKISISCLILDQFFFLFLLSLIKFSSKTLIDFVDSIFKSTSSWLVF